MAFNGWASALLLILWVEYEMSHVISAENGKESEGCLRAVVVIQPTGPQP